MKMRVMLAGLLLIASASSALAAGPYMSAAGGVSITHDSDITDSGIGFTAEYDTGFGFNVGAGYNFDPVRVAFEFGYKNADVKNVSGFGVTLPVTDGEITVMSYMLNVYYDIDTKSMITPYIGVGIGALNGELKSSGDKDDDTVFGYQGMVGVALNVNKNFAIDLSYHFLGAASDFSAQGSDVSYMSSNVMAGVRLSF